MIQTKITRRIPLPTLMRLLGVLFIGLGYLLPVRPLPARAQESQIISDQYLYAAYGLRVENSLGKARYPRAAWTDRELSLLNDVLRSLPPSVLEQVSGVTILRSRSDLDPQGNPDASRFGLYLKCDLDIAPDCSGLAATIRIFDRAHFPFDFADDPQGDKQFRGTVLHELAHAMQNRQGQAGTYPQTAGDGQRYDWPPLIQEWIAATRSLGPTQGLQYCPQPDGWALVAGKWIMRQAPGDRPPTNYATTEPAEDMAESVMLYVYDPQRLKDSSVKRYNFIRDHIFGGVEYEDGIQKPR